MQSAFLNPPYPEARDRFDSGGVAADNAVFVAHMAASPDRTVSMGHEIAYPEATLDTP